MLMAVAAGVVSLLLALPPQCGAYQQATTLATFRQPAVPSTLVPPRPFAPQSLAVLSSQPQPWRRVPTARRATIDIETPSTPPLEDDDDDEGWTEGSRFLGKPVPYNELTVGVLKERYPGENRVSQSPDSVALLVKAGLSVVVETGGAFLLVCLFVGLSVCLCYEILPLAGSHTCCSCFNEAGERAEFPDSAYEAAGATVVKPEQLYAVSDIVTQIRPPSLDQVPKLAKKTLVSMVQPGINPQLYDELSIQKATVFALDCVPRMLSRGQTYDVLSSQANVRNDDTGAQFRRISIPSVISRSIFPTFSTLSFPMLDCRVQGRHRGGRGLSSVLRGTNDGGGEGPARQGFSFGSGRCRLGGDSDGKEHGRHRPGVRRPGRNEGAGGEHGGDLPHRGRSRGRVRVRRVRQGNERRVQEGAGQAHA
jgi:Alanine dehydrogenase/PNT, N-terminal domain